jgi:hypothetical protein
MAFMFKLEDENGEPRRRAALTPISDWKAATRSTRAKDPARR